MIGKGNTSIIEMIFTIFVIAPFYLIAKNKYYYFVPESIISDKSKHKILNIQIIITVLFTVFTFVLIRDLSFYEKMINKWVAIIPLTLILFATIYGILLGLLFMWFFKNYDEKYNSYLQSIND